MGEKPEEPTLNIVVNSAGIKLVQFVGQGWEDEAETQEIYRQIKHLIREIDRVLKSADTNSKFVQ